MFIYILLINIKNKFNFQISLVADVYINARELNYGFRCILFIMTSIRVLGTYYTTDLL
jgi:hypothetical protein